MSYTEAGSASHNCTGRISIVFRHPPFRAPFIDTTPFDVHAHLINSFSLLGIRVHRLQKHGSNDFLQAVLEEVQQ